MSDTSEYAQFRMDLGGLMPLGEKMKLLNRFVARAEEKELYDILKPCEGLPQYDLLTLLLADKFRRSDLIMELLHRGDAAILSAAVLKRWLYEGEDSLLADSEFLMNKLFPTVSYNCRQKVLYRIGRYVRNVEKADRIWKAVEQKYGFNVAFPILPACSKIQINSVISNRKIDLNGSQLTQILEKFPDIGLEYLKNHYANASTPRAANSIYSYRLPLYYLYKNRPDDFLDLCISYPDKINCFKFGRARSTNLIRTYRAKLLENPAKFSSILKLDRIRREFSTDEFQMLFESSLAKQAPANVNNDAMWKWVNTVQKTQRIDMINRAFAKLFQINLDEHPEFMSADYMVLLPDEKRLSVVQWKIENDTNHGWSYKEIYAYCYGDEEKKRAWLPLKPVSHSVPELQKLLLIEQDGSTRATLSKYLIETCFINESLPQLQHVLNLLNKRSRNDQSDVRGEIFRTVCNIMEKMDFSKELWDVILEMIQVSFVFKDKRDYSDTEKEKLVAKCIAFHLAAKLPLNHLVSMHIKLKIQTNCTSWTTGHIKHPADKRTLFELYAKELENLQLANNLQSYNGTSLDAEQFAQFIVNFIDEICQFNKSQTRLSTGVQPILISSNQWLRTSLENIAKEEEKRVNENYTARNAQYSWCFAEHLNTIIQTLRKEQNLSLDAFKSSEDLSMKILRCSPSSSILEKFLWTNLSEIIEDWSTTLSKVLKSESGDQLIRKFKSWNYSTLVTESIKVCRDIISQTVENDLGVTVAQKCNAVLVLSILSDPSDFLALAAQFYPPETKVDVFAEKSDEDYQIRQTFAKSLINVTVPHLTFEAIENFSVGDYLKLVVGAFYSQTCRASAATALAFLRRKIVNTPVSLQKHIIRQYFKISSVEEKCCILNEIDSSNVSIRFEMFLQASKLLRMSPSQETWSILKATIEKTTVDDANILLFLHSTPNLDTCPLDYISDYIGTCLTVLRTVKADKIEDFLNQLVSVLEKIPEKTLDDIILYNGDQVSFSSRFCVEYLQTARSTTVLDHRLSNMWSLIQSTVRNGWNRKTPKQYNANSFEFPTRMLIWSFIESLCLEKMNEPANAWIKTRIFETLLAQFKLESVTKFFKEILYLELSSLLIKEVQNSGIERLRSFGCNLARLTDSLVGMYGGEVMCIVNDIVDGYVRTCLADELIKNVGVIVELIDAVLETSKTRHNQIIAITLIQNANPKSSNLITTLEKINAVLSESDDVVAQMYFSSETH